VFIAVQQVAGLIRKWERQHPCHLQIPVCQQIQHTITKLAPIIAPEKALNQRQVLREPREGREWCQPPFFECISASFARFARGFKNFHAELAEAAEGRAQLGNAFYSSVPLCEEAVGNKREEFPCCFSHRNTGTRRVRLCLKVLRNPPCREPKVRCASVRGNGSAEFTATVPATLF
jgi:hypothetical protein